MSHTNVSRSKSVRLPLAIAGLVFGAFFMVACNDDKGTGPGDGPSGGDSVITRAALIAEGGVVFSDHCTGCHGLEGEGSGSIPPLLHSDFFMEEKMRPARIILMGLPNSIDTAQVITVNGVEYAFQSMPAIGSAFSDTTIASLMTYIRVVLNDSTSTNCRPDPSDSASTICDLNLRTGIETDSVSIAEVAEVRDSLIAGGHYCPIDTTCD